MTNPAKTPRRAPKNRPETLKKREEILRAAMEVFGSKGYVAASLADVADRVGMTHAGVLHHFGSKRNLLLETVRFRDVADIHPHSTHLLPTGREQFDHLIETALRNTQRVGIVKAFVTFSAEAITDEHPALEYFQQRYQRLRKEITENFVQLCADEGIEDAGIAEQVSASILAVMDGLQYQWLLQPEAIDLVETTRFAINTIVDATLGPPGG